MNFDQALSATREVALSLGVVGNADSAQKQRAALAAQFVQEWSARVDKAYRAAPPSEEPMVRAPFGLWLVHEAEGDLRSVTSGAALRHALEREPHSKLWFPDSRDLDEDIDRELNRLRAIFGGFLHADD